MKRVFIGMLLILHGLAHSALGVWSTHLAPAWVVTPLWITAQAGFIAAGFGLLGAGFFRKYWEPLAVVAAIASICYFEVYGELSLVIGLIIDAAVLVLGLMAGESALLAGELRLHTIARRAHPWRHAVFTMFSVLFVGYVTLVIGARPVIMRWGTTHDDQLVQLPGDDLVPVAHYQIDHAIVIQAPAARVWPWLAQIGQDRAGFYSYDWLERLFGDDIHNAERVYAEWQHRSVGDLVPATQSDYLGGRVGSRLGWKVASWIDGQAIVLEGWGTFVLRPIDSARTVLHVRTRGEGSPTIAGSLLAPAGVLLFEPAHFIMEREMLRGIKRRAEQPGVPSPVVSN